MKRLFAIILGVMMMLSACQTVNPGPGDSTPTGDPTMPTYAQLDYKSVATNNPDINEAGLEASYLNQGNLARLAKVIEKANRGEKVVIAALGGSITEGMSATRPTLRYSSQVLKWFRDTWPNGNFELANAGIGSTGSIIGGGRMQEDVLQYNPDLIIIEFACNDGVSDLETESYEGVIYRALTAANNPAVMLVYFCREDGGSSQAVEIPVGLKFDLPMISYNNWYKQAKKDGLIQWSDISPDIVHPNDRGHAVAARLITHRLELVKENLDKIDKTIPPVPATESRFVNQNLKNSLNFTPKSTGAFKPATKQYYGFASLSSGWVAEAGNTEPFIFETESNVVTLVFKRQVMTPGAKLKVIVDGWEVMTIDSNGGAAEYADLRTILTRDNNKKVTVELRLTEDSPAGSKFLLLGIVE
jgi:lysophospholipase L1-like esterase